jgi:hypothetical protein
MVFKVPNEGKASPRFEICRKATVEVTKTRREKDDGSEEEAIRRRQLGPALVA